MFSCLYFTGKICRSGQGYTLSFSVPIPEKVETKNNVEIIRSRGDGKWGDGLVECHGTAADLIAGGFITQDQVPGKYARKSSYDTRDKREAWTTLRQPDGTLLFSRWTKPPKPSETDDDEEAEEDPGIRKELVEYAQASPARFDVGDACMFWDPDDDDRGMHVEITEGYKLRRVRSESGAYVDKETGQRFDYQWGYLARPLGQEASFSPAHRLRDLNGAVRHIRLVSTDGGLKSAA